MAIRVLPVLARHPRAFAGRLRRRVGASRSQPVIEEFVHFGFVALGEVPGSELVLGAVGRFWRLTDNDPLPIADAAAFRSFADPGYVKAALNLTVAAAGRGSRVATETRVIATSDDARRSFARYWRLIMPGSALIRRSWLAAIRRRATAGSAPEERCGSCNCTAD
ncbi:MAG: hypothetical protein ACRDKX_06095 [Solirubrobacterales bacterium]